MTCSEITSQRMKNVDEFSTEFADLVHFHPPTDHISLNPDRRALVSANSVD
jgi:hypothetical protein